MNEIKVIDKKISDFQVYEHIEPNPDLWPIAQFTAKRKSFLNELVSDVVGYFNAINKDDIDQAIARTIYLEKQRVNNNPWKADPPNEIQYFRKIQNEYNENQLAADKHRANKETLLRLIKRYGQEILGHFNTKTFLATRKISDYFFYFILYPFQLRDLFRRKYLRIKNREALRINGHCEEVRTLFKDHVVVLVPTHSSNLDSILIGYTIDLSLGLPAFAYGAGLNLFDSEFFAFFMNRLGAYKVDRRKKNPIYLQVLNSYSKLSVLRGLNTIFFPGGTRSRSGEVETKVKLGLLGSLVQAQRTFIEMNNPKKIIVVPVVIGYESVLEARSLIIQHLRTVGQEKYTARVKRSGLGSYLKFFRRLMRNKTKIILTFGKPMDVLGNEIGKEGVSIDHKGKIVNLRDYFVANGILVSDNQREMIYTRELGEQIAKAYQKYNYILPAHLIAFAAFKLLCKIHPQMDEVNVVQIPEEEFVFPRKAFEMLCLQLREVLFQKAERSEMIYPDQLTGDIQEIIQKGIETLGVFHIKRALLLDEFGRLLSNDFLTLMFYANKMSNLLLDDEIDWNSIDWEADRF